MKVTYDARADTLTVLLREAGAVAESDQRSPGVILDYDVEGHLVAVEILDASRTVSDAQTVDFQTVE